MFFGKNKIKDENKNLNNITALLIHAAKIDENFSVTEEKIIEETILQLGAKKENIKNILIDAKKIESDANQILEFTREVKTLKNEDKIKIIEALWKIIYSNNEADIYETSLMRRLAGLLYIDNKTMGDIKEKIKTQFSK
mgnify:FL=1|tara:strand:- start:286 stop:702 length:417 start_codon:yes stop_codon:yes gene_type:complete